MSESRKRLSLGKKARKQPQKPVQESVSPDLMLDTLLEESEKKVEELKAVKELNAKKEDEAKAEPQEETEKPEEDEKEEKKPSRQRLDLGKKKRKLKKEEVKEAKIEAPKEKLVTDRNMFNVPEDEKKAAAERLKAKTAAKRAAKQEVKEEVLETPEDRIMSALDGQLSAMGRLNAADAPAPKSLSEQKIENLEGQVRDMRRMMLEFTNMPAQNTIVGSLGAGSPGSGEVRLSKLDDVVVDGITDGQTVVWDAAHGHFHAGDAGGVTQDDLNDAKTYAIANSAGYFFQNSHYFSDGLSHANNPDVIEEAAAEVLHTIVFSDDTEGESGGYLQAGHSDEAGHDGHSGHHDHDPTDVNQDQHDISHFYDPSTGVITLHHAEAPEFILVRLSIDIEPDSDNSSADIVLEVTSNGESGAFTFTIEEQLASLDQGADTEYPAVASIPIFIGDTLKEAPDGSPATIVPKVRLRNTTGDIKPRSLAFFIWS